MDTATTARTVKVELPAIVDPYRALFPCGVMLGGTSGGEDCLVYVPQTHGGEYTAAEARELAAAILAAADAAATQNAETHGVDAFFALTEYNKNLPCYADLVARGQRFQVGDRVGSVAIGHFVHSWATVAALMPEGLVLEFSSGNRDFMDFEVAGAYLYLIEARVNPEANR